MEVLMTAVDHDSSDNISELYCSFPVIDRHCPCCFMMRLCLDEENDHEF